MSKKMNINVTLEQAQETELPEFRKQLQAAFAIAVIETFGSPDDEPIPSDEDIQKSFDAPDAVVYHIVQDGQRVGGVVLRINSKTHRNSLDLFYISQEHHSHGIGLAAWQAIEAQYPDTLVWETVTPYFEKRNIHFYVNKCGFQIVEFFNKYHPDPHMHDQDKEQSGSLPDEDFFRFEKVMPKNNLS